MTDDIALFTDLYELKMAQAFLVGGQSDQACFSLFYRSLPEQRNYMLACGLDSVLTDIEQMRFHPETLDYLRSLDLFTPEFIDYLANFRFSGEVRAVPEGTPVFPGEPMLEVIAPLPEAQLIETLVINRVHSQSIQASKAARVVTAARGNPVLDFGARRIHGVDGAVTAARAFYIAGVQATSNVLAGRRYGIPVAGTMAHSFIQAFDDEMDAFRAFSAVFPDTVLLVDTYDTLQGVDNVIRLAAEQGSGFRVQGIRIDSGDLAELSRDARRRLDEAGLKHVRIVVSGGLDEWQIDQLLQAGAPVAGFGVGTEMGVPRDGPSLDIAYKLTSYGERGRIKLSPAKRTLPGQKQVFRLRSDDGGPADIIGRWNEALQGEPLLKVMMRDGRRLHAAEAPLEQVRQRAAAELAAMPADIRALPRAPRAYPVTVSDALQDYERAVRAGFDD